MWDGAGETPGLVAMVNRSTEPIRMLIATGREGPIGSEALVHQEKPEI